MFAMRKSVCNLHKSCPPSQGLKLRRSILELSSIVLGLSAVLSQFPMRAQATPAEMPQEMQKSLKAAESYYTQQQYRQAESELHRLLLHAPQNYSANELLGLVLSAEGRDAAATAFFEKAVRANPVSIPARENLATNYAKRHENTLAQTEFETLVKLDPKNFDLQHNLGEFYVSLGEIAKAVAPLRAAQALKPTSYANGYDLALAEMMSGRLTEAQAQIQALLAAKDTAELHSILAEIYEKQNNFMLAGKEFQRAVEISPTEDAIFEWGTELLRHKNLKESAQVFSSGVNLYPQSWRMNTGLGISQSLLGHNQEAAAALLHAVDLNSTDPLSYFFLAKLDSVPPPQAFEVAARFERYAKEHPNSAQAQLYYANNLWKADQVSNRNANLEKIESLLKKTVRLDPALAEAHMQLGILYARREEHPAAAAELEEAIKYDPTLAVAHYRLAQSLIRLGQKERAEQELKEFRRLNSAQKEPDVVMAFLLNKQDKAN